MEAVVVVVFCLLPKIHFVSSFCSLTPMVSIVLLVGFPEAGRETVTSVLVQYELGVKIWKAARNSYSYLCTLDFRNENLFQSRRQRGHVFKPQS